MPMPLPIKGKIIRLLTAAVLLGVAVWSAPTLAFGQNIDTWTCKGIDGKWSNINNWDNGLPTATSDVLITNACPSHDNGYFTINSATINAGGEIVLDGASWLEIKGNSIVNNGQLFMNGSAFNDAYLILDSSVILSGNGFLQMSDIQNVNHIQGSGTLINQSTILGTGTIGDGQLGLQNLSPGLIDASGKFPLFINPNSSGMTNTGTLEATIGSLVLEGGLFYYTNTGGSIEANGGTVLLQGNVFGGTLGSNGYGYFLAYGNTPGNTLDGVILSSGCSYRITSGEGTILKGSITNNGQFKLSDNATLTVNDTATLQGSGSVTTYPTGASNQITGSGTLVNQQTIQGVLTINVSGFVNQGTVTAFSQSSPLTIQPGAGGVVNSGVMQGTTGTLVITTGTVTNTGGTISGNVVLNGGVTVAGGTLAGTIEGINATVDGTSSPVTNSGTFVLNAGDTTTFKGTLINNGTIEHTAVNCNPCPNATAKISGSLSVTGPGTWKLFSLNGFNSVIEGHNGNSAVTGSDALTNGSIIQGSGIIGNNTMNFVNSGKGVVNANSSLPLTISMASANSFTNQGLLSVAANPGSAPSVLTIKGPFKNFKSAAGTLAGGSYSIGGTLQFDNASIVNNAAKLTLAGQIVDQNNANALLNFASNLATGSLTVLPQTFGANFTSAGPFGNAGKVAITKGVAFIVGGSGTNYNQTGGATTVDGRLAVPLGGLVNITGGTLQGGGALPAGATISGSVSLGNASTTAATFIIGDSLKKSGLIVIANNYTQLATGVLDVQIGGTTAGAQYSQLNITGTAALAGTLNIKLTNKFKPTIGQTFTLLNAASGITGAFSVVNGAAIDTTRHFSVSYTPTTVVLTVVTGAAPADS